MKILMVSALLILAVAPACSTNPEDRRLEAPAYASLGSEFGEYIVICGAVRTLVHGNVADLFYTDSGELKSQAEFCAEESVSTRIRR